MGLSSLIWFLLRVIPKPSRAAYPCQRLAFPVASGFVVWLPRCSVRPLRGARPGSWELVSGGLVCGERLPRWLRAGGGEPADAAFLCRQPPHGPVGVAKGIFPGRVAWVYAPRPRAGRVTSRLNTGTKPTTAISPPSRSCCPKRFNRWAGTTRTQRPGTRYSSTSTRTMEKDPAATRPERRLDQDYLTTCNARSGSSTVDINGTYEKQNSYDGHWLNSIDAAPQLLLSLLRHLVNVAGVNQTNISLGIPLGTSPNTSGIACTRSFRM